MWIRSHGRLMMLQRSTHWDALIPRWRCADLGLLSLLLLSLRLGLGYFRCGAQESAQVWMKGLVPDLLMCVLAIGGCVEVAWPIILFWNGENLEEGSDALLPHEPPRLSY